MSPIKVRFAAMCLASVAVMALACGSENVSTPTPGNPGTAVGSDPGIISGYDAVYYSLRNAGGQVDKGDEVRQPFFAAAGRFILVNGQGVQVFEYQSVAAADRDAQKVSPDGGKIGTSAVAWTSTPHFYRQANTIVLYVGDDDGVLAVLNKALGRPFAGGKDGAAAADETVPAPIEEIQVAVLESFPVLYRLLVRSGLPNSCAKFDEFTVRREGDVVRVAVNNRVPTGRVACAQVYGTIDHVIDIGTGADYGKGRAITVIVNDKKTSFVAQ